MCLRVIAQPLSLSLPNLHILFPFQTLTFTSRLPLLRPTHQKNSILKIEGQREWRNSMQSLEGPENGHYACSDQTQGEKDERAVSCEESAEKTGRLGERKKKKERRRSAQTVRERIRASLCEKQKAEKQRGKIEERERGREFEHHSKLNWTRAKRGWCARPISKTTPLFFPSSKIGHDLAPREFFAFPFTFPYYFSLFLSFPSQTFENPSWIVLDIMEIREILASFSLTFLFQSAIFYFIFL